jgi:predicted ester cyclase
MISQSDNAKVVLESIEAIWNRGEYDRIPEFYTEDFVSHQPGTPGMTWPAGHEGVREISSAERRAFPDYTEAPMFVMSEGDFVAVFQVVTGTNTGEGSYPATGKAFQAIDTMFIRMRDGKLAEQWGLMDLYAIAVQLGLREPVPGLIN